MPKDTKPQLSSLAGICRRLNTARDRVAELEAQRDHLIKALRDSGVSGATLAAYTGLSAGRVTQITQSPDGHGAR
jgi:hypothetical protein